MNDEVNGNMKCGIVMPISKIDGCDEAHWKDVSSILSESIRLANFIPNLVSAADDIGVIQKRIIQNLYDNPIVVCDVSGKNPNVMFELGLRLAFDKPTIIIKDDKTSYSFDTSPIEHLEYPRDLRFTEIIEFKESLTRKIKATYKAASEDPNHSTFLKHFGTFTIAKIEEKEVSHSDMILAEIRDIKQIISKKPSKHIKKRKLIRVVADSVPALRDYVVEDLLSQINLVSGVVRCNYDLYSLEVICSTIGSSSIVEKIMFSSGLFAEVEVIKS